MAPSNSNSNRATQWTLMVLGVAVVLLKRASRPTLALVVCLTCCGLLLGQAVSPALKVEPIVDPLSEMSPSPKGEVNDGILDLDIEHLSTVDAVIPAFDAAISSVTKQESTVGKSPAAVYVITSEMIRRCGATCIPEALRLAPGVEVTRLNSSSWNVSIRGFQDRYVNKLLVMIDGRSVYSPVFSGVFWDMLDMPLEDIERIEVIRGPGGTLWGANAVNGVINIISKKAKDTQGGLVSSGGGNQDYNISVVRHGGTIGENLKFRVWGKYVERGPEDSPGKYDDWRGGRGGFYADWNPAGSRDDLVTVQGNFFGGEEGTQFSILPPTPGLPFETTADRRVAENSILARWTHTLDDESDWSVQTYYDQTYRNDPQVGLLINTFDVELQYRRKIGRRHQVVTGMEYRQTDDALKTSSATLIFNQDSRSPITRSADSFRTKSKSLKINSALPSAPSSKGTVLPDSNTSQAFVVSGRWTNGMYCGERFHGQSRTPTRFDESATSYFLREISPMTFGELNSSTNIESEDVIAYEPWLSSTNLGTIFLGPCRVLQ